MITQQKQAILSRTPAFSKQSTSYKQKLVKYSKLLIIIPIAVLLLSWVLFQVEYQARYRSQIRMLGLFLDQFVMRAEHYIYMQNASSSTQSIQQKGDKNMVQFCLIVFRDEHTNYPETEQHIIQSLSQQTYSNYKLLTIDTPPDSHNILSLIQNKTQALYPNNTNNILVMIVNQPLQPAALSYINSIYQQSASDLWMLYTNNSVTIEIIGFALSAIEVVLTHDYTGTNRQYLEGNDRFIVGLIFLELFPHYCRQLEKQAVYADGYYAYYNVDRNNKRYYKRRMYYRVPYLPLLPNTRMDFLQMKTNGDYLHFDWVRQVMFRWVFGFITKDEA